jgi:hypothetical protein
MRQRIRLGRSRTCMRWSTGLTISLTVLFAVAGSVFEASAASASRTTYFLSAPNNGPDFNPQFVVRPKTLLIHNDGDWVLQDLKWRGWGSSVARGIGTSFVHVLEPRFMSASVRSDITLSYPGEVQHHE